MVYTKTEKDKIERVRELFAEHIQKAPILICFGQIKWRWKVYIDRLPEYAYLCDKLLGGKK